MNHRISLVLGGIALLVWAILGLIVPLGAGWIHLLLAVGILLLVRGVVLAPVKTR